jgi:pimeloyl-ACP methyl ester carboxylesterase
MPQHMHETAPTQFVQVGDLRVAYRRFGKRGALPLLLINYFAANMDYWDPRITNGLAAARDVIIFDYPGIGQPRSAVPTRRGLSRARAAVSERVSAPMLAQPDEKARPPMCSASPTMSRRGEMP